MVPHSERQKQKKLQPNELEDKKLQKIKDENKKLRPNELELEEVKRAFEREGVTVYTVLHPDSTADEERAFERKRTRVGMKLDGKEPPRPGPKKKVKRANKGWTTGSEKKRMAQLSRQGMTVGAIARIFKRPVQTVSDVLKRFS